MRRGARPQSTAAGGTKLSRSSWESFALLTVPTLRGRATTVPRIWSRIVCRPTVSGLEDLKLLNPLVADIGDVEKAVAGE